MTTTHPLPSSPHTAPHWAWHRQQLERLRDRLLENSDVQRSTVADTPETHSADTTTGCAADDCDHEMALTLLAHDTDALREITAAIQRIDEGTYGICEQTCLPIAPARLRAVPWARHTREVEEQREKLFSLVRSLRKTS